MKMSDDEKNTLYNFIILLVALAIFGSVFLIPSRGKIAQSARLMPFIVATTMLLLSSFLFLRSVIRARPNLGGIIGSIGGWLRLRTTRRTLAAVGILALYCFVAVPHIGYYVSSAALIMFISLYYVRRIRPVVSIVASLLITAFLYVVFTYTFGMPLL